MQLCFIVSSVCTLASRMSAEDRSVLDGTRRVCFRHFLVWQSKDLKHDFDTDSDSAVRCNCFCCESRAMNQGCELLLSRSHNSFQSGLWQKGIGWNTRQ